MRKAFIVAIGSAYIPPITPRQGSLNDLADLQTTLATKRGFTQFSSVTDGAANRSGILAGLTSLVQGAVSGDSIMFAFFGHGTPGGICPVDVNPNTGANVIWDHEINAILYTLPFDVTCDVLLGCCYAGTGTRSLEEMHASDLLEGKGNPEYPTVQYIRGGKHDFKEKPPKIKTVIPGESIDIPIRPKVAVPVESMNHCLFAASAENGLAWEVRMKDGSVRGLHTLWWCYAIRNALTWSRTQVDSYVSAKVKLTVPTQDCQVEGPASELAQVPFT
jgi:hypothetical protein